MIDAIDDHGRYAVSIPSTEFRKDLIKASRSPSLTFLHEIREVIDDGGHLEEFGVYPDICEIEMTNNGPKKDVHGDFIMSTEPRYRIRKATLYNCFVEWAKRNGVRKIPSSTTFFTETSLTISPQTRAFCDGTYKMTRGIIDLSLVVVE